MILTTVGLLVFLGNRRDEGLYARWRLGVGVHSRRALERRVWA